ncbi:MAG TPA: hypothetical protein PKC21_02990 [Oligoflexia bacterium]|nr:hypothetical protein [Oligoflexia bacterium]HMR24299.1 hypothetical protein [Oligoflexia bacterium]
MKIKLFLLVFIFYLVRDLSQAQERGLMSSSHTVYQEMTKSNLINNEEKQKIICNYASLYQVNPLGIVAILWKQAEFQDEAELVMSDLAKLHALNQSSNNEMIELYKQTKLIDIEYESHGLMIPSRNSFDGIIFNSIGASEIKIYIAMRMVETKWFQNAEKYLNEANDPDPLLIVNALRTFEGSVEFIAAALYWMKTTYANLTKIKDVTQNLGMVWQLHKTGNFNAIAMRRRTHELSGNPLPIRVSSNGHIPKEILNAFDCSLFEEQ